MEQIYQKPPTPPNQPPMPNMLSEMAAQVYQQPANPAESTDEQLRKRWEEQAILLDPSQLRAFSRNHSVWCKHQRNQLTINQ